MWLGLLLTVAAVLCNIVLVLFANLPGNRAVPWLSLLLAVLGLIFLVVGLRRVFAQPRVYRGKIRASMVSLVSLLLACMAIFVSVRARTLPASAGAPQVGQKAPDFTLADTTGQPISLDQLFVAAPGDPGASAPRAVLLIFYRGYW